MTPERWVRVREVFEAALQEPAERRSTFLALAAKIGPKDSRTRETVGDLVALYERWGKPKQAASCRVKTAS